MKKRYIFALGALVGGAAALFLAPKSGKELQADLLAKVEELQEKVKDFDQDAFKASCKEQLDELKEIARLKNAEDKGIQEGIREGIEQGIEQGIQEGVLKNQKEIVLNMYKEKIELDIISKVTKLTLKEIDEIINNN